MLRQVLLAVCLAACLGSLTQCAGSIQLSSVSFGHLVTSGGMTNGDSHTRDDGRLPVDAGQAFLVQFPAAGGSMSGSSFSVGLDVSILFCSVSSDWALSGSLVFGLMLDCYTRHLPGRRATRHFRPPRF